MALSIVKVWFDMVLWSNCFYVIFDPNNSKYKNDDLANFYSSLQNEIGWEEFCDLTTVSNNYQR